MQEAAPRKRARFDRRVIGIVAALCLSSLFVYAGVGSHDFVEFDDRQYILANPHLDGRIDLADLQWAWTEPLASNWAPMMSLSLLASDALHGPDAGAYAWTNVGLHTATGVLLFLLMLRLSGSLWPSAWVAAVFLVHPLHVESVAWISQRKEVLAGCFWMAALHAHAGRVAKPEGWGGVGVFVFSLLAMGSKATAVAIPVTLLLLDFWPLGRFTTREKLRECVVEKWPLVVMAAGVSLATLAVQTDAMATESSLPLRILNAALAYSSYLAASVWPVGLSVYYPYHDDATLLSPRAFAALGWIGILTVAALACGRRFPFVTMGWSWFLLTLVPMIGIVQVGGQSHADRYMYFAQIGLTILVAFGCEAMLRPETRAPAPGRGASKAISRAVGGVAIGVVVVLSVLAQRQVGVWRSTVDLFAHAVEVDASNYFAQGAVGKAYWIAGDRVASEAHLLEALRLRPDAASARVVLATLYLQTGRSAQAEAELDRAFADGADPATVWAARGVLAGNRGDERAAANAYERAIESEPETRDWEMLNNLAWIRAASRDPTLRNPTRALELARRAAEIRPEDPFVRGTLAGALASAGQHDEAVEIQKRAIEALRERGALALIPAFEERLADYAAGRPPWQP